MEKLVQSGNFATVVGFNAKSVIQVEACLLRF